MTCSVKINIANVLEVEPGQIRCLALNENSLKLALFRGGKFPIIEIWDVSHIPFMERTLIDLEKVDGQASVESMVWSNNRLFSCGLHGFLLEHDMLTLKIKGRTVATSGPVWCMEANPKDTHIAAGTEDGFINIFEVFEEGLVYLKVLDRQEGRVLCLSWSPCGKYIATGSIDSVRIWDVEKGHALQRLMTGRSKQTETIVWSILMLEDFLVISGDSRGTISFWDGIVGVLKHKTNTHKADILSLKLSSDKATIYAAGVDPMVVILNRSGRNGDKWVKSHQRVLHTNDVTCLASYGNKLFSAGVDADLVVSSFPPKIVTKYPPLPQPTHLSLASAVNRIVVQNPDGVDIWRLPGDDGLGDDALVKLIELKSRDTVQSSCQSPGGNFFAYSTLSRINFFYLSALPSQKTPQLTKLNRIISADCESDDLFLFLHFVGEHHIFAYSSNSRSLFFEVDETDYSVTSYPVKRKDTNLKVELQRFGNACLSAISPCGKFFGISNDMGSVLVIRLNFENRTLQITSRPPLYRHQATSLSFHHQKPLVLFTYLDHSVKVWNYKTQRVVYETRVTLNSLQPILGSKWSSDGEMIVIHEVDKLYLLSKSDGSTESGPRKRVRKTLSEDEDTEVNFEIKSCGSKYKYISFVDFNDKNELVLVEIKPNILIQKLPPAFAKKRFGM